MDPRKGQSPAELKRQLELTRKGAAYLVYRDSSGDAKTVEVSAGTTIGRDPEASVSLSEDPEVSRFHCELQRSAGSWLVVDDGLSRNGTWVNGSRIVGRMRLADNDLLRVGSTKVVFCDPAGGGSLETMPSVTRKAPELSPTQRRLLVALCRPLARSDPSGAPASNQKIADELHLSLAGVKSQVRTLFERFEVEDLPHHQKRARLATLAIESGAVSHVELAAMPGMDSPSQGSVD